MSLAEISVSQKIKCEIDMFHSARSIANTLGVRVTINRYLVFILLVFHAIFPILLFCNAIWSALHKSLILFDYEFLPLKILISLL